jgi:hypothetical protein
MVTTGKMGKLAMVNGLTLTAAAPSGAVTDLKGNSTPINHNHSTVITG